MPHRRAALLLPLLVAAGCTGSGAEDTGGAEASASSPPPEVAWGACGFEVPAGVQVDCGTIEVPADRAEPGTGTVTLAFGVVRTEAEAPADDPVVYLSGGPGQSTLELVPMAYGELYEPLAAERDVVLLDQRGTGLSEPSLACEEYGSWVRESLDSEASPGELADQAVQALEECRQRLADEGVDPADYNSAASAADLDDLRRALEYDRWNLYGVSYGTRLAQTAVRDFPDGIRSVVLDSAYPVDADLYEETPGNAVRAMEGLFGVCAADADCAAAYPDLGGTVRDLVSRLEAEPVPVTVLDPNTGQRIEEELDGAGLVGFLFQSLYSTDLISFLPEIIAAADRGEVGTIGLLLSAFTEQLDLVATGQQLAVQCQEEVPFADREEIVAAAADQPLVEDFFTNAPTVGSRIVDVCASWHEGEADAAENEPVRSDIPALVLAGELDPITPPRWGEEIAEDFSGSVYVEFPATGHGTLPAHDCAVEIATAFLADPGSEPDTGCADDVDRPVFTADGVSVEMTPFDSAELGLSGLRPEGWTEVLPGVTQESVLVSLVQQVVPGATADQLLQQLAAQLGSATPEPVDRLETDALSWDLYRIDDLGQRVDLALAQGPQGLVLVQLTAPPARSDVYREQVFLPAVEALSPAG